MYAYWLLFLFFAAGALNESMRVAPSRRVPLLLVGMLLIAVVMGMRYEVGADWIPYKIMFYNARFSDLERVLGRGDPGYQLLNWSVQQAGGQLWTVNLICALIFVWGLRRFVVAQTRPWLAALVAIPYLVIVVMCYTRQGVAIGILMAGMASYFKRRSSLQFAMWAIAAALFHKTAVAVFPLVALTGHRGRLINVLIGLSGCALLYDVFLSNDIDLFVKNYINTAYASQGAAVRIAMSLLPAVLFLANERGFRFPDVERAVWRNFALATLLLTALLFLLPSTTAVDRLALYVIPLQLAVWSRFPGIFTASAFGSLLVVAYSAAVQFTWLNFAVHAQYWLPYRYYPL